MPMKLSQVPIWRGFAVAAGIAAMAVAQANLITNGGFEQGSSIPASPNWYRTLPAGNLSLTGWSINTGSIDWIHTNHFDPSVGSLCIDINGNSTGGSISQSFASDPGRLYSVAFDMSGNPDNLTEPIRDIRVSVGGFTQDFSFDTSAVSGGISAVNMGYVTESFTFWAPTTTSTLSFLSLDTGIWSAALDNIQVELVPEPTAMLLLALGVSGISLRRRARAA